MNFDASVGHILRPIVPYRARPTFDVSASLSLFVLRKYIGTKSKIMRNFVSTYIIMAALALEQDTTYYPSRLRSSMSALKVSVNQNNDDDARGALFKRSLRDGTRGQHPRLGSDNIPDSLHDPLLSRPETTGLPFHSSTTDNPELVTKTDDLEQWSLSRVGTPFGESYASAVPDEGQLTKLIAYAGLAVGFVFSIACISLGLFILRCYPHGYIGISLPSFTREIYFLVLNLTFVEASVYAVATIHETALRWTIALEEGKHGRTRLEFNSNFRFLQSSKKWFSANGLPANVVMAFCLAATYASSSLIFMATEDGDKDHNTIISYLPLIILGSVISIQGVVCTWAIATTDIPTWSQSPFDTVLTLLNYQNSKGGRLLVRVPGRCMHAVHDIDLTECAMQSKTRQRPPWKAHPEVRRFVLYIWCLIGVAYYVGGLILGVTVSGTPGSYHGTSWALLPNAKSPSWTVGWQGKAPISGILWAMGVIVGFQGGVLTAFFACLHHLVSLSRDEKVWAEAGSEEGTVLSPGLGKMFMANSHMVATHAAGPIFHWVFGQCVRVDASRGFQVGPVQIFYICTFAAAGASIVTYISMRWSPEHQIPVTLGHLQTLADLIDEWPAATPAEPKESLLRNTKGRLRALWLGDSRRKLYWGHKRPTPTRDSPQVLHAGTSGHRLNPPLLGRLYGGLDDHLCFSETLTRAPEGGLVV